jgi:hypothetical protein
VLQQDNGSHSGPACVMHSFVLALLSSSQFIFRENAKALRFDALIEEKVICTSPREDNHPTLQLDPRKEG